MSSSLTTLSFFSSSSTFVVVVLGNFLGIYISTKKGLESTTFLYFKHSTSHSGDKTSNLDLDFLSDYKILARISIGIFIYSANFSSFIFFYDPLELKSLDVTMKSNFDITLGAIYSFTIILNYCIRNLT